MGEREKGRLREREGEKYIEGVNPNNPKYCWAVIFRKKIEERYFSGEIQVCGDKDWWRIDDLT